MKNITVSFDVCKQQPQAFEFFVTYEHDDGQSRYVRCLVAQEPANSGRISPESFAGFLHQAAEAVLRDNRGLSPVSLLVARPGVNQPIRK